MPPTVKNAGSLPHGGVSKELKRKPCSRCRLDSWCVEELCRTCEEKGQSDD
jgi:hypothetical protein